METPVLLAHAIEDSTDIFGISGGGGVWTPPRYATVYHHRYAVHCVPGRGVEQKSRYKKG